MAGGKWRFDNKPELFGSAENLCLAFLVLIIVIILTNSKNKFLRMGSIVIGLIAGYIIAAFMGKVNFSALHGGTRLDRNQPLFHRKRCDSGSIV